MYHLADFRYTGFDFGRDGTICTRADIQHHIATFIYPLHDFAYEVRGRAPILVISVIAPSMIESSCRLPGMTKRPVGKFVITHRLKVNAVITHLVNPKARIYQYGRIKFANHGKHITHLFFGHLPFGNRVFTPTVEPEQFHAIVLYQFGYLRHCLLTPVFIIFFLCRQPAVRRRYVSASCRNAVKARFLFIRIVPVVVTSVRMPPIQPM